MITEITFVINELATKTESFSGPERFVAILFDEMKVQEDLVWDKNTGELIGFVDLGEISVNYATLQDCKELAIHYYYYLRIQILRPRRPLDRSNMNLCLVVEFTCVPPSTPRRGCS